MKKLFIVALLAVSLIGSSYGSDATKVNYAAKHTFNTQFAGVTDVEWTVRESYTKASFQWRGANTDAFFDASGNLIGTTKAASIEQLPVGAKREIVKRTAGYTITEVIAFENGDNTSFFVSAVGVTDKLILKVSDGDVSTFKKTKI